MRLIEVNPLGRTAQLALSIETVVELAQREPRGIRSHH
jgi:hypothetical protein